MKTSVLVLPIISVFLMSSTYAFVTPFSKIARKDVACKERLVPYTSESITTLSHIKKDVVATLTFNYEVYQMWKSTEVYSYYQPSYIMMYQADIYVNNAVQYKGGLFNWFDGTHAGFLDRISIKTKFTGLTDITNAYQTPSDGHRAGSEGLRFLRGVNPHSSRYTYSSEDNDKQTKYNCIDGIMDENSLPSFQTTPMHYSNSYYDSQQDFEANPNDLESSSDFRLNAYIETSQDLKDTSITYNQSFKYNWKLNQTSDGQLAVPHFTNDDKLYSGPCTNGVNDSTPFNFTFYGVYGFESDSKPKDISVDLYMHTYHGSHTSLDTFDSEASKSFNIQL